VIRGGSSALWSYHFAGSWAKASVSFRALTGSARQIFELCPSS
jgi:hypothetical protein